MERIDGRKFDQLRPVKVTPDYIIHPKGSVLMETGNTKVICTATVEEKVPPFMKGSGEGWVTAEYSMLPGSTGTRKIRNSSKGKIDGRSQEIQRLIGRSLRSVVDLPKLGERTIWLDCDVIQADGGTRTASITGAFIALSIAVKKLMEEGLLKENPIKYHLAATSVGIFEDQVVLDLNYHEDSSAKVDMNIIMTDKGEFVELQGTGEDCPFTREELMKMMEYGEKGINELIEVQKSVVDINSL
ncbi:MAG: ribonuclease PH [Firmicutes bacterium]|jgi:ribonuclease PH|nr:ribonuclease PH [Bacillota bacterium]